jgi:peptidase A4-like protein
MPGMRKTFSRPGAYKRVTRSSSNPAALIYSVLMTCRCRLLAVLLLSLFLLASLLAAAGPVPAATARPVSHPLPAVHLPAGLPHTHLPTRPAVNSASNSTTSGNWAGYAAVACDTCALRYAAGTWTVPAVDCADSVIGSSGYAYVSEWAGLDGFTDGTVEQTGVSAYCTSNDTAPVYYAWYEMYPRGPVTFGGVSPGDVVSASVFYSAVNDNYQLNLTDQSTGGVIATTQDCAAQCGNASAEMITEDPGGAVSGGISLADFGRVNYSVLRVTSRIGVRGDYGPSNGFWSPQSITMASGNDVLAHPGDVTNGGAAFPVYWDASS